MDRIRAEFYAYPIQKARLSDPKQAFYPIQWPFLGSKRDAEIGASSIKKAACEFLASGSKWRRRESNPRPVNPWLKLLRV
jgi:hypothetical protein